MGTKAIWSVKLTEKLSIAECRDGFWIYDYERGFNLAMRAKTEREAFTEALACYQKDMVKLKSELNKLNNTIDTFIKSVSKEED